MTPSVKVAVSAQGLLASGRRCIVSRLEGITLKQVHQEQEGGQEAVAVTWREAQGTKSHHSMMALYAAPRPCSKTLQRLCCVVVVLAT